MTYLASTAAQLQIFLQALGFGFFLGLVYACFRFLRQLFFKSRKVFIFSDFLFGITAGILTFLFSLAVLNGRIRGYVFAAICGGFFLYLYTVEAYTAKKTAGFLAGFRRVSGRILRWIFKPLRRIFRKMQEIFQRNVQKWRKIRKFSVEKSKIHLQRPKKVVYNQSVKAYTHVQNKAKQKGSGPPMRTAKQSSKRKPAKKQSYSFILALILLVAAGYFCINIFSSHLEYREKKEEAVKMEEQLQNQEAENARLQAVVDGGDEADYMERVAREKLGYVMPNEKVYYDITPSN